MSFTADVSDGDAPADRPALRRMRDRLRRRATRDVLISLAALAVISFLGAAFVMDPRLTSSGIEIHFAGIPMYTIPYDDLEQVRVRKAVSVLFSTNPFRLQRAGGCFRDDVVELKRRHGWFTTVVVCPSNRAGFARDVAARRHREKSPAVQ